MEDKILDKKLECCSIMTTITIENYIELIENAYLNKGGIKGQREPLKQKTAINIRNRMVRDIVEGTILPPIVIGVMVDECSYDDIKNSSNALQLVTDLEKKDISIIDGMQRTTAIYEALLKSDYIKHNQIRIEMWVSYNVNSLLYRMLVLNAGQVPWNMRRQVELVFDGVISQIKNNNPNIEIINVTDNQRRSHGGQYNAHDIVEMFMSFGARTWKIDTKERLTDEFTRGDLMQSTGESNMVDLFCKILNLMFELDCVLDDRISYYDADNEDKFKRGRDLFASQPAKIGFAAACGEYILGRPGEERKGDIIDERFRTLKNILQNVTDKAKQTDSPSDYIDFSTLSEVIVKRTNKVGDYEREKFYSAFKVMIETGGNLDSFTVCWRA